jgi:hypothetical protein
MSLEDKLKEDGRLKKVALATGKLTYWVPSFLGKLGAGGILVGSGKGFLEKYFIDGLSAFPRAINYLPDIAKDAQRLEQLSEGVENLVEKKPYITKISDGLNRTLELYESAKESAAQGARQVGGAIRDTGKAVVNTGKDIYDGAVDGVRSLDVGGIFDKLLDGNFKGALRRGKRGLKRAAKDVQETYDQVNLGDVKDNFGNAREGLDGILHGADLGAQAMHEGNNVREAITQAYDPIMEAAQPIIDVVKSLDYNGMYVGLMHAKENLQPDNFWETVIAMTSAIGTGALLSKGIKHVSKRGAGTWFDNTARKLGKKIRGGYYRKKQDKSLMAGNIGNVELERETETIKLLDYITVPLQLGVKWGARAYATLAASGAAFSTNDSYFGRVNDALKFPTELYDQKDVLFENGKQMVSSVDSLTSIVKEGTEMYENITKLEGIEAIKSGQEMVNMAEQGLTHLTAIDSNLVLEYTNKLIDTVNNHGYLAAAVAATVLVGVGHGIPAAYNAILNKGKGTFFDILERWDGKNRWPDHWKEKIRKENQGSKLELPMVPSYDGLE